MSVCTQVVGINNAQPSYALDVTGDVNLTGDIRIGGAVQSFGGGTPSVRVLNSADSSNANWVGNYSATPRDPQQLTLTDTKVICYYEDDTTYGTPVPYCSLPLLSTVSVGHTVTMINLLPARNSYISAHETDLSSSVDIIEHWRGSSITSNALMLIGPSKNVGVVTCIEDVSGTKKWIGYFIETA